MKRLLFGILTFLLLSSAVQAQVRLKDIALIRDQREIQLKGLGLITGLEGTGDGKNTQFTIRMIGNMMKNFGIEVPSTSIKVKNAAAVMVTANVSPYTRVNGTFDVSVSSLGDAKSLEGGTLLMTILTDANGTVYGNAQGTFSIGGANRDYGGAGGMVENATLTGVVPGGGILEREIATLGMDQRSLTVTLRNPDYTTAYRLAMAINGAFAEPLANARDAGSITILVPETVAANSGMVEFISRMENITVETDEAARVVINERTGTIVAGANVSLAPVAIMHGTLALTIGRDEPALTGAGDIAGLAGDRMVSIAESADVGQIARSLNLLGVTPRDMIAIFQALKVAGSLRAELLII